MSTDTFGLLYPSGAPFKGIFLSAKMTELDERWPKIPNWIGGSDHTLDANATVALRGTSDDANKLTLDVPVELAALQTLSILSTAEVSAESGATVRVKSGASLLANAGSTFTVSTTEDVESGGKVRIKSGATLQVDAGATATFAVGLTVTAGASSFKGMASAEVIATYAATLTLNYALGSHHTVILTGNITLNATNTQDGGLYTVLVQQDGTGGRTVSWGVTYSFGALSSAPASGASTTTIWLFRVVQGVLLAVARNTA